MGFAATGPGAAKCSEGRCLGYLFCAQKNREGALQAQGPTGQRPGRRYTHLLEKEPQR